MLPIGLHTLVGGVAWSKEMNKQDERTSNDPRGSEPGGGSTGPPSGWVKAWEGRGTMLGHGGDFIGR